MHVHVALGFEVICLLLSSFDLVRFDFQGFSTKALSEYIYSWTCLQLFQDESMINSFPISSDRQTDRHKLNKSSLQLQHIP